MRTARAGVLFPRPSGLAKRQNTHPSTSGLDGCKRTAHEGARDSPSLECRGRHPVEHPGCVVWDAAGTHKRPRPRVAFFSRQGEKSERSGITLPDTRGWSTQVTDGERSHCPLGKAEAPREATRREEQCDRTVPLSQKQRQTHSTTRERACASDRQYTAQAAQPHATPTWFRSFHCGTRVCRRRLCRRRTQMLVCSCC